MDVLIWLVVGVAAGLLTQYLLHDRWRGGVAGNLILGAMGAVVAGWIMKRLFGTADVTGPHIGNLLFAFLGALGLLWVGRLVGTRRARTRV